MADFTPIAQTFAAVGGLIGSTGRLSAGKAGYRAAQLGAASEMQAAEYNAGIKRLEGEQVVSRQGAISAGAGLATRGSVLDQMMEAAFRSEQNQQAILYGGRVRGQELLTQGALTQRRYAYQGLGQGITG